MDIKDIIQQHSPSVAVLFKKKGIAVPVTTNNLMLHTILGGQDFIEDLANQIEQDDHVYTGYNVDANGIPLNLGEIIADAKQRKGINDPSTTKDLQAVTVTSKKKKDILEGLGKFLSTVAAPLGAFLGAKKAAQSTATQPYSASGSAPEDPKERKEKKKQQGFLIAGIAVIFILVVVVLTQKK